MLRRIATLAVAITIAAAPLAAQAARTQGAPQAPTKPTGVLAAVQGVWQMTNANGQDLAGSGQDITITIKDNTYVQAVNGQVIEKGTFKVDEGKKPMTIDINVVEGDDAGKTQLGVFELTVPDRVDFKETAIFGFYFERRGGSNRVGDFFVEKVQILEAPELVGAGRRGARR